MAFHNVRAYFTGYRYEPDPDPQQAEPDMAPAPGDLQSIVETIVREKVGQEPEEQLATAEGDTTFRDLIERQEEKSVAGPEPMPSVLDTAPVDAPGGSVDLPAERIVENGPEPALGAAPDEGAVAPNGAGPADETDVPADRLGLDGLFGAEPEALGGMLGEPGYDDVVDEALAYGRDEAGETQGEGYGEDYEEADGTQGEWYGEETGETPEGGEVQSVEDLLPDEEEVLGEPAPAGDRGFLRSVLRAPERRAAMAARRLADVTINIGIDGEGEDVAVGLTGAPPLEPDGSEGSDFDFEAEAAAAARRVLASDVTINIDIGGADEPDIEGPEEEFPGAGPELPGAEDVVGEAPMSDEELIEGLEAEPKGQSKQDKMEAFDELDDLGDVFESGGGEPGEQGGEPGGRGGESGGESGEIEQLGI